MKKLIYTFVTGIFSILNIPLLCAQMQIPDVPKFQGFGEMVYVDTLVVREYLADIVWVSGFTKGDTILSLGSRNANDEIAMSYLTDSIHFYFEDINMKQLQTSFIHQRIGWYDSLFARKNTISWDTVSGSNTSIYLPDTSVHKVFAKKVFHEFDQPAQMTKDIYRVLKPGGELIIVEYLRAFDYKKKNWKTRRISHCKTLPVKRMVGWVEALPFQLSRTAVIKIKDQKVFILMLVFRKD